MRILSVGTLYPPQHLGGYELVWEAAVRALREAGHSVDVLCTDTVVVPGAPMDGARRTLRWYWVDHAWPRRGVLERRRIDRWNRSQLSLEGVDLVSWWHLGGLSLSMLDVVRRAGVPAIGWVNDDWMIYGPREDQWLRLRRGTVDLSAAARWVFCSEAVRAAAPPLADSAVHYQGVAPDFSAAPAREWTGELLYVGRLDVRKGIRTLVEALDALPEMRLRIVGDGDPAELAVLQELAGERVTVSPGVPRSELQAIYAAADAVVFPVEWAEPWGLVPLEAMAVGRPVVATGRGGSGEYLVDRENALLFEAASAGALVGALRHLAADASLRRRLVSGGFDTAARLTEAAWTAAVVREHETRASTR